jgi:hypothetical protein
MLRPLAESVLPFFLEKNQRSGASPYDMQPWKNSTWRIYCGLQPLKQPSDKVGEAEMEDSDGVDVAEGFVLSKAGHDSLKPKDRRWFDQAHRGEITEFLLDLRKRAEKEPKQCLLRVNLIPGYGAYQGAMLAMLNRPGGVMYEVEMCMNQLRKTPVLAWRDKREENEVSLEGCDR